MISNHFLNPAKLTKSAVPCVLISIVAVCIGGCGLLCFGGGLGIAPKNRNMFSVFNAAPFRVTVFDLIMHFSQLNAPPPYDMTDALIVHPSQSIPSRGWSAPTMSPPIKRTARGGTVGSAAATRRVGCCSCARVDVWMNKDVADETQAPTINDPNASATLVISSPSKSFQGNCTRWVYHYDKLPGKQRNSMQRP
jgi:hypothetical protein